MIEDDADYRLHIRLLLSHFFVIDEVATLAAALAKLRQRSDDGIHWQTDYFAVLLDLGLPDSDCRTTFPAVALQIPAASVIIVSQHDDPEFIADLIRWGAAGYFVKGKDDLQSAQLYRMIRNAVAHQRVQSGLDETTLLAQKIETDFSQSTHPLFQQSTP